MHVVITKTERLPVSEHKIFWVSIVLCLLNCGFISIFLPLESKIKFNTTGLPKMFALSPEVVRLLSFKKLFTVFRSFKWTTSPNRLFHILPALFIYIFSKTKSLSIISGFHWCFQFLEDKDLKRKSKQIPNERPSAGR